MARKSKPKTKITDEVLEDLETLKDAIEALDEVLQDEHFGFNDIEGYCYQIETLAITIKNGVKTK